MINTQDLERIFALTFYSAYVANEKPVSVMLISDRPESGKSEIAMKYLGNPGIGHLSDVTAYALWRDFKEDIEAGTLKHIVIPEFLAPLSRKSETVQSLISTLQMLIEEGIIEIHTGFLKPMKLKSPTSIGVIACLPKQAFAARHTEWELSGFLSRFLVVSYSYDKDTVNTIFESIATRQYFAESRIKLIFPPQQVGIDIPADIEQLSKTYVYSQTEEVRTSRRGYGFRDLKNILRLLCANVIMTNAQNGETRVSVEMDDFEEIRRLSYLVNEEFNTLKSEER